MVSLFHIHAGGTCRVPVRYARQPNELRDVETPEGGWWLTNLLFRSRYVEREVQGTFFRRPNEARRPVTDALQTSWNAVGSSRVRVWKAFSSCLPIPRGRTRISPQAITRCPRIRTKQFSRVLSKKENGTSHASVFSNARLWVGWPLGRRFLVLYKGEQIFAPGPTRES